MDSQTGHNPKWFFPSVGDQMLSEITVAKGPKCGNPHRRTRRRRSTIDYGPYYHHKEAKKLNHLGAGVSESPSDNV